MNFIREWVEKYYTRVLLKVFKHPSISELHSEDDLRKYARWGANVTQFFLTVATFFVMQYIFSKILDKLGFEKTVVILLVLLAFLLRNFLEIKG